jgi:hypothetical protein
LSAFDDEGRGELPALDPSIVDDDEMLGAVVDVVIRGDFVARTRATDLADHYEWLRRSVDKDVWKLALEIESRTNERWADLAVVLTRWGFEQGRRFPIASQERGGP